MKIVRLLHVAAWFAAASLPAVAQITWDPTADFSNANGNPNGAWTYGWMDTGFATFTPYSSQTTNAQGKFWYGWGGDLTPAVWVNTTASTAFGVPPGFLTLHPGNGTEPSVLRWTAPADYPNLALNGQFFSGDSGVMSVAIFQNTKLNTLWSATDAGGFNFTVSVLAGDTLNFAVFGGYSFGNTPLQLSITAVPEPSALAFAATIFPAVLAVRFLRRRGAAHSNSSLHIHSGHVSCP